MRVLTVSVSMMFLALRASGREANPESCRLSWYFRCPSTEAIEGFDQTPAVFVNDFVRLDADIVVRSASPFKHMSCRLFLNKIFSSLSDAVSNISTCTQEIRFDPRSADYLHEWDLISLRTIRKQLQNTELDLCEIHSSIFEDLRFIATAPGELICLHAKNFFGITDLSSATLADTPDILKQSLFTENVLKFRFDRTTDTLICLANQLCKYPLHLPAKDYFEENLKDTYNQALLEFAADLSTIQIRPSQYVTRVENTRRPLLFYEGIHLNCYGHALLDNIFSIYLHLSAHGLLDCPIAVVFADSNPVMDEAKLAVEQLLQSVSGVAAQSWLPSPRPADAHPRALLWKLANETDHVVRAELDEMVAAPYHADQRYSSIRRSPLLRSFIDRILTRLGLARIAAEPRLVTLVLRLEGRRILNHRELAVFLEGRGYTLETAVMTRLTLREQALQARRSSTLLSSYGSNIANAVFMHPGTRIVVCLMRAQ